MRIQLIQPAGEIHRHRSGIFKRSLRYAPMTLPTLAALVPEKLQAEITLQDEGVQELNLDFEADLVGISAITGTALRAYEVADRLRAQGHTVVLGGVHPTLLPHEAAAHADSVVVGHAEESWPELLQDFVQGRLQPRYSRPTPRTLKVPVPRRDLLQKGAYITSNTIEATRGCPYKCEFCAVPAAWSNVYAHRPIAEVIAELESFAKRHAVFIDLSPIEDVQYAKQLYRAMIPLRMRWLGLSTARITDDDELLRLAADSGCVGLLIGFEAIDQPTLNAMQKHFHHARRYQEVVKKLHDHGIAIQGCFVFGFDEDDESVFERTVAFVDKTKIDLPRYAVMTPFPGTAAYHRLRREGRLLHEDWSRYDVEHVVFQPKRMSPEQLQAGLEWSWQQSYSWRSMTQRILGSRCALSLSVLLNVGYRYFAKKLPERTWPVYRDPHFIAENPPAAATEFALPVAAAGRGHSLEVIP